MLANQTDNSSTRTPFRPLQKQSLSSSPNSLPHYATSLSKSQCNKHSYIHALDQEQPTYSPEVQQIPYDLYPKQWQNLLKSRKEHWQFLTKDNRQRDLFRAEQKVLIDNQLMKKYTFEPTVSNFELDFNGQKVYDRLFDEAHRRKKEQLERQKQAGEEERKKIEQSMIIGKNKSDFSFMNKEKFDLNPLYLRLQKVMQEQLQQRKMIAEKEVPCSFHPTIDKRSAQIVQNKKDRINNIVDRLISDYKLRQNKVNSLRQKINEELDVTLTFRPKIHNFMPPEPPSKVSIVSLQMENRFSYKPQINSLSAIIAKEERNGETRQQMINRMHNAPILRLNQKLSFIESEMYAECSFNPEINQLSRQMAGEGVKSHLCPTPVKESPTYRPRINEASKTMTATKRARSLDNIKQKSKTKAQTYVKATQYDELKECTFKPRILSNEDSKNASRMTSIDSISGYKRFMRNKEKAQQQQKSRKALEQKLFNLQKSYDQRMLRKSKLKKTCDNSQNVQS